MDLKKLTAERLTYIDTVSELEINGKSLKKKRNPVKSDVFTAIAVVIAKAPPSFLSISFQDPDDVV